MSSCVRARTMALQFPPSTCENIVMKRKSLKGTLIVFYKGGGEEKKKPALSRNEAIKNTQRRGANGAIAADGI